MGWFLDLFRSRPEPFDSWTVTILVFGPDREICAAEVETALGKRAAVQELDGAAEVADFIKEHGPTGKLPRCELVFAHFIPIQGGEMAPQEKVGYWAENWSPHRSLPHGDVDDPRVRVDRVGGTNRVFVRVIWEHGASAKNVIRVAQSCEKLYQELADLWVPNYRQRQLEDDRRTEQARYLEGQAQQLTPSMALGWLSCGCLVLFGLFFTLMAAIESAATLWYISAASALLALGFGLFGLARTMQYRALWKEIRELKRRKRQTPPPLPSRAASKGS